MLPNCLFCAVGVLSVQVDPLTSMEFLVKFYMDELLDAIKNAESVLLVRISKVDHQVRDATQTYCCRLVM